MFRVKYTNVSEVFESFPKETIKTRFDYVSIVLFRIRCVVTIMNFGISHLRYAAM